jgi:hypothetical protein
MSDTVPPDPKAPRSDVELYDHLGHDLYSQAMTLGDEFGVPVNDLVLLFGLPKGPSTPSRDQLDPPTAS